MLWVGSSIDITRNGESFATAKSLTPYRISPGRYRNYSKQNGSYGGSTDSELANVLHLDALENAKLKSHGDILGVLCEFSDFFSGYGSSNLVIMVGKFTFLLANVRKPVGEDVLQEPGLSIQADKETVTFASEPLIDDFVPLQSGDWFYYSTDRLLAQGRMKISTQNSAVQGV